MKAKSKITTPPQQQTSGGEEAGLPGYPLYPDSEDIYTNSQKEHIPDFEDVSNPSGAEEKIKTETGKDDFVPGNDLDVPGSELDDKMEIIGSEDEENNYYSLGGDDHNELDEDKGD